MIVGRLWDRDSHRKGLQKKKEFEMNAEIGMGMDVTISVWREITRKK